MITIESHIGDILAHYWLVENPYCGLAETVVLGRLNKLISKPITINGLHSVLLEMQTREEVVIGRSEVNPYISPRRVLLEPRDSLTESEVGIYTKQLRLGGSQISHRYFSKQVLDRYLQDPRHEFKEFEVSGRISTHDDAQDILSKDRIYIRFGYAYEVDGTPAITVILKDLSTLSKEQQQYWASYEIHEECQLDADYVKQNLYAEPIQRISLLDAILAEIVEINTICDLIVEPHLFKKTYEPYKLPKIGSITKPTADELRSFVNELDKLLSQNINKSFFKNKVTLTDRNERERGTLVLLNEFLQNFGLTSSEVAEICNPLRNVRKYRRIPAHKIVENEFNSNYWLQHRIILKDVHNSVRLLRRAFERHPGLENKGYMPPKRLDEWQIG